MITEVGSINTADLHAIIAATALCSQGIFMKTKIGRRALLRIGGGLATSVFVSPGLVRAQATPLKPDRIVVNASGGGMNVIFRRSYFAAFEKLHGIRIVDTSPVDFGKLRAMVENGNPEWTVTEIGGQDGPRAKELNLLESLDGSIIDRSTYPDTARDSHLFSATCYTTALGYRTDVYTKNDHPKGWSEFWDVKRFPGPRSLRNHPTDNLEFALMADRVPMDKLYPIDMDRAFRKLDEIYPHINVWWTTGAQPAQLLVDKEVALTSGWSSRFYEVARRGAPIGTEFSGGALKTGTFGIPRGTRQTYWGQQFLQVMTQPELQASYASEVGNPGLHRDVMNFVPAELHPLMCTAPANLARQFWLNVAWWTANAAQAQERWSRWMLQH